MMYHILNSLTREEQGKTEDFAAAKIAADKLKEACGFNYEIESRSQVYTTSTLEEAVAADVASRTHTGRLGASVQVGDHSPEARRDAVERAADAMRHGR